MKFFNDSIFKYSEIKALDCKCFGFMPNVQLPHVKFCDNVNNYVISEIAFAAFMNQAIEAVDFSESIEIIGQRAFENCKELKYVFFKGTQKGLVLQNRVFADCKLLTGVTILRPTAVMYEAFRYCSNLRNVDINASEVLDYAFANCPLLHTVLLTSENVSIAPNAFEKSSRISDIYINGDIQGSLDFVKCLPKNVTIHCKNDSTITELVYDGIRVAPDIR